MPIAQEIAEIKLPSPILIEHLQKWNSEIDPQKLQMISMQRVTWNNGSLGCPMPGKCYTQALVPGYLIWLQQDDLIFEVHTDLRFQSFAMPGVGFF